MAVVMGIPSVCATFRQLFPSLRSLMASSRRKTRLGRPSAVPRAFAARTPAHTRSRIADADLEEVYSTERHLLYVACTRARDHLLVTGVAPAIRILR
jgi:ATP-dependent exoDNAse (exonuclease V) beta subunit